MDIVPIYSKDRCVYMFASTSWISDSTKLPADTVNKDISRWLVVENQMELKVTEDEIHDEAKQLTEVDLEVVIELEAEVKAC